MNFENIFYLLLIGTGLIIAIIAAYYIFKGLRYLLTIILETIGRGARILFKTLYLLLMIAISAVGFLGIGVFVESVLQNKPLHFEGLGVGIVLLFIGSNGFVRFIKNGFKLSNESAISTPTESAHSDDEYAPGGITPFLAWQWGEAIKEEKEREESYWKQRNDEMREYEEARQKHIQEWEEAREERERRLRGEDE